MFVKMVRVLGAVENLDLKTPKILFDIIAVEMMLDPWNIDFFPYCMYQLGFLSLQSC